MAASDHLGVQFVYASPERRQAVREAVAPVLPKRGGSTPAATVKARNEGVIRALTFSNVPVEHLAGLTGISANRKTADNTMAQYSRKELRPVGSKPPLQAEIRMNPSTADELSSPDRETRRTARKALIHEVGHHVHAKTDPQYYFGAMGATGGSEAIAENYADKHGPKSNFHIYDDLAERPYGGFRPLDRAAYKTHRSRGTQPYDDWRSQSRPSRG